MRANGFKFMNILIFFVLVLISFIFLVKIMEDQFIYYPEPYPVGNWQPESVSLKVEDCFIQTDDNLKIHGWYVAGENGSNKTILWFHGNAGNISHRIDNMKRLAELGFNVLIIDYRGYGRSEGKPSEKGLYQDAVAAYRFLAEKRNVSYKNLILFGRSLGGAIAVDLAVHKQCAGVILESSFTSVKAMAKQLFPFLPVTGILKTKFDSIHKIEKISCPILLIHGTNDELVPYHHGLELFEKAREPKYFYKVEAAGHNDLIYIGGERYFQRIKKFIEEQTD